MDKRLLEKNIEAVVTTGLEALVPLVQGEQAFSVGLKPVDERRGKLMHASEFRKPPEVNRITASITPKGASYARVITGTPEELVPVVEETMQEMTENIRKREVTKPGNNIERS